MTSTGDESQGYTGKIPPSSRLVGTPRKYRLSEPVNPLQLTRYSTRLSRLTEMRDDLAADYLDRLQGLLPLV